MKQCSKHTYLDKLLKFIKHFYIIIDIDTIFLYSFIENISLKFIKIFIVVKRNFILVKNLVSIFDKPCKYKGIYMIPALFIPLSFIMHYQHKALDKDEK